MKKIFKKFSFFTKKWLLFAIPLRLQYIGQNKKTIFNMKRGVPYER